MVNGPPVKIFRHRYTLMYVHQPELLCFLPHIPYCLHIATHRVCVGHQVDGGVSAFGRRPAARFYILFMGVARIAKMAVQIHKSRQQRKAAGVDYLPSAGKIFPDGGDFPVPYQYIGKKSPALLY